jgi:UDP-glucose 4-epimerase
MNIIITIRAGYIRSAASYFLLKKNIKWVIIGKLIYKKNNIILKSFFFLKSIIFGRDFKIFVNNHKTQEDTTVREFIYE